MTVIDVAPNQVRALCPRCHREVLIVSSADDSVSTLAQHRPRVWPTRVARSETCPGSSIAVIRRGPPPPRLTKPRFYGDTP